MLGENHSETNRISAEREIRRQQVLAALRADAEGVLERRADALVDLPEDKAFGQIEYDLRDLAHELAASAHKAGLRVGKKRARLKGSGMRWVESGAAEVAPLRALYHSGTHAWDAFFALAT
jgi:hypothetical protein